MTTVQPSQGAFVGVQLGSHSVFDEGADHCLDVLRETAGVNAVFVYAMTYQGFSKGRALGALAPDHGVPLRAPGDRETTEVWTETHDAYYEGTFLRHRRSPDKEYADRDVLAELMEPAAARGMAVYARILEGFTHDLPRTIPNWIKVMSVDVYGRPTHLPCWNHPAYRNWWLSTVADLFTHYPLAGFKYGAERGGPLGNLLKGAYHGGVVPTCFCEHCRARAREQGIDVERARQGLISLYELVRGLLAGQAPPSDGVFVTLLRTLLRYPEVLAWEREWHEAKEEVARLMYGAIKTIRPEAQVGWHIYHNGTTWSPLYRALTDYSRMVEYSDWLKPVLYHDIAGPRMHRDVGNMRDRFMRELSERQVLDLLYAVLGYDGEAEPRYEELVRRGLSPDYVYRETRRCVAGVGDRIPVYPGIGFDIPWKGEHFPSDPDTVYQATRAAFRGGASGLIISREYDEMRLDNLRAVGRAVHEFNEAIP